MFIEQQPIKLSDFSDKNQLDKESYSDPPVNCSVQSCVCSQDMIKHQLETKLEEAYIIAAQKQNYEEARLSIEQIREAIEQHQIKDFKYQAKILKIEGIIQSQKGQFVSSLENFIMALQHLHYQYKLDSDIEFAHLYNNIAIIYIKQKKYNQALEFLQKSLKIYQTLEGPVNVHMSKVLLNVGNIKLSQNCLDEAMNIYDSVLKISEQLYSQGLINDYEMYQNYSNIGIIYIKVKNYSTALNFTNKALAFLEKWGQGNFVQKGLNYYYTSLILNQLNEYKIAIIMCQNSIEMLNKGLECSDNRLERAEKLLNVLNNQKQQ